MTTRIVGTPLQALPDPFPAAQEFFTAIEHLHRRGYRGQGVRIPVVDSGIRVTDPVTVAAVTKRFNLTGGDPSDVTDRLGHGELVARIILALAPDAEIIPIRIFGTDGECPDERVAEAFYLAAEHGDIINASIGSDVLHPAVEAAVNRIEAMGKTLVCAGGNSGDGNAATTENHYPASLPYPISVAAWDRSAFVDPSREYLPARPSRYSSSHKGNDVSALGRIPGTWKDGTSFGAPVITGALACFDSMLLVQGRTPNDAARYQWLLDHTRQFEGLSVHNDQTGYGMFTLRAHCPERLVEIDVDTLQVTVDGQAADNAAMGLENRAPGGLFGWFRPFLEAAGRRVGYDANRRRAQYWL